MADCDPNEVDHCVAKKRETVAGQLTFQANKPTRSLKCELFGNLGPIPVPLPGLI